MLNRKHVQAIIAGFALLTVIFFSAQAQDGDIVYLPLVLSYESIGDFLLLSPHTVRGHFEKIRTKLSFLQNATFSELNSVSILLLHQGTRNSIALFVISMGFRPEEFVDMNHILTIKVGSD